MYEISKSDLLTLIRYLDRTAELLGKYATNNRDRNQQRLLIMMSKKLKKKYKPQQEKL